MKFIETEIPEVKKIVPKRFGDNRGYFSEVFKDAWFRENIADVTFVQDNESLSAETGTIRGLHFQTNPFAQGKLVRCIGGALLDVAVDIRHGSPTFGKWVSSVLSAENGEQLWGPRPAVPRPVRGSAPTPQGVRGAGAQAE
ncbi:MAG: dTDP-4-dehydrorhamnose 3,5-epimerase family protein, partial [Maritimibacter sp.]